MDITKDCNIISEPAVKKRKVTPTRKGKKK